jgi:DNA mismatch repair protein PMS2
MINEVYREFVPQRCPAVIMNLTLEKGSFDVNVTPDKRTILLHEQDKILDWLRNQLSQEFAPFRQSDHIFSQSDSQNTPTSSCLIQSASFLSTQSFVDEDEDDSPRNPEISLRQSTEITLIQNKENFSSSQPKTPQITSIDITDEDVAEALPSNLTRQSTLTDLFSFNSTTSTSVSSVTKLSKIRKSASSTSLSSSGPSKKQRTLSFSTPSVATRRTRLPIFSLIRKDVEVDTHDLTFGGESPPQESQQDFPQTPLSTRRVFSAGISSKTNDLAEAELERFVHKQDFTKMEVIGQFNLGFIVVRLYDDLFVVDQHAR